MLGTDQEAAQRVTFEGKVRSVTLDGDVYEPSGTISGGSAAKGGQVLQALAAWQEAAAALAERQAALAKVMAAVEKGARMAKEARDAQATIELQTHALALAVAERDRSPHAQAQAQLASLRAAAAEQQALIASAAAREREAQAEVRRIEAEMKELSENREGKLKALKTALSKARAELTAAGRAHKAHQQQQDTVKLEMGLWCTRTLAVNGNDRLTYPSLPPSLSVLGVYRASQARCGSAGGAAEGGTGVGGRSGAGADRAARRSCASDRGAQRYPADTGG
jgi:structural maintenance of chromosome 2